jgi:hypothetical protein
MASCGITETKKACCGITETERAKTMTQVDASGSEVTTTFRILKHTKTDTMGVPQLGVFDVIYDIHNEIGHTKSKKDTWRRIKISYYNVTAIQIEKFMELCPVCVGNKEAAQGDGVAKKEPIAMTAKFRDRFQVSLIDFTEKAMKDMYGTTMRWLMVMMDHGTRLVYIRCIPLKLSRYVAYELNQIFGLTGYPEYCTFRLGMAGNSRRK